MIEQLWKRYPALFYGIILYLGSLFALQTAWVLVPFCLLLHKKLLLRSILLFLLPSILTYQLYSFPLSQTEVEGIYTIKGIRKSERYGVGWSYQGILKTKKGRIHCRMFSKEYMSAHTTYKIQGKIRATAGGWYVLKTKTAWEKYQSHLTITDFRYRAQEYVKEYISRYIPQPRAAHFLSGMVTGQLEDKVMQKEFSQLGLSHLMAISGLHFSLLALAFHGLLLLFLPPKVEALTLMTLLTLYFLFVGTTPSVVRAWTMALVFLMGLVLERRASPINSLGVALCLSLLWDPFSSLHLSFQLSFLATAGILFFYTPSNSILQKWIPKGKLQDVAVQNVALQYFYFAYSFLRESIAITIAVNIPLLPLMLTVFHSFPTSSLFYNLFFPFLASIALLFFLVSIVLGPWAHFINGSYCDWILRITESPPLQLKTFYVTHIPNWLLTTLLTAILIGALYIKIERPRDSIV